MNRWSEHTHIKECEQCKTTITFDGCWKIYRAKCSYEFVYWETEEFKPIQIGCQNSPEYNSFFCKEHRGKQLSFKIGDETVKIDPKTIKPTKLSNI